MSPPGGRDHVDALILGGGMGGASVAAHLAPSRRVVLLEREASCGYHATGRSAAMFLPSYGPASVRPLTQASRAFLEEPPPGFGGALLRPRDALHIARRDQLPQLEALAQQTPWLVKLDGAAACDRAPILRRSEVCAAMLETAAGDIDVDRLHRGSCGRLGSPAPASWSRRARPGSTGWATSGAFAPAVTPLPRRSW